MNYWTLHGCQIPQIWTVLGCFRKEESLARATCRKVMRSRDEKTKAKMAELIFICKSFSGLDRKTYMQMICAKLD